MNIKYNSIISFFFIALLSTGASSFEGLSDQKLNAITAGNANSEHGSTEALTRIPFRYSAITAGNANSEHGSTEALTRIPFRYSSNKGSVDGEVIVVPMTTFNETSSLLLMGNAQSNLQSFININAVNSPIQVLLNLNINVNSTIGNINQLNNLLTQ